MQDAKPDDRAVKYLHISIHLYRARVKRYSFVD
jgi:hypothetical protein